MSALRTFGLMGALTLLLVFAGGMIGGRTGAVLAFILAAGMNFFSYWFSDKMVLRHYRAQEAPPGSRLHRIVEPLVQRSGLPMPKIYIIPDATPNAFATGRNPSHAAVAATEGILRILDDDELAGVMAHELAHIKNRDILTGTIAATLAGAVATLAQFGRFGMGRQRGGNPMAFLFLAIAAPMAAMFLRMAVSRVREYAADRDGAEICGKPLALASALARLSQGARQIPIQRGNPAHSHLFIVNPFLGGLQRFFATHPPMEERIRRLKEIDRATH